MTAGSLLVVLAFYVAAADLVLGRGLVGALASPPALALVAGAGLLAAVSAIRAARAPGVPGAARWARLLARAGLALTIVALPASFVMRDARTVSVGEDEILRPVRGRPPIRFGKVRLAPRGPHLLSKTVEIEARAGDDAPVRIGLFPPAPLEGRRWSVFRFGYAPGFALLDARGEPVAQGFVKLGTLPQSAEAAALVQWTPETNLMMGAGTFPPRLEDLVSAPGSELHVFLRIVEATIGGVRRDLTDPDAHRWMLDGRLEEPVLFAQVFRGRERVYEGRLRGGERVAFPGGSLELARDVLLWVDLVAVSDPWLPVAFSGLGMLGAGIVLGAAAVVLGRTRRAAPPAAEPPPAARQ